MATTFDINGATIEMPLAEMDAALAQMRRLGPEAAARAIGTTAEVVVGEAQADAPVREGHLQRSHKAEPVKDDPLTWEMRADVDYAVPVHVRHPTKRNWFLRAILTHAARVLRGAIEREMSRGPTGGGGRGAR